MPALTGLVEPRSITAALIRGPPLARSGAVARRIMGQQKRPLAFVAAATDHGTMIVNRFDRAMVTPDQGYGVGYQLLENGRYDPDEVGLAVQMLDLRRRCYGDGVIAIDCGANVGVHSIEWAKHMTGWGIVVAVEAQERIFYALAGNIALNNCFNARAIHAAVASQPGTMKMPSPNYLTTGSFGSLELKKRTDTEFIGQPIDYSESKMVDVRAVSIDSLVHTMRVDLIKIDVEGMELEVLAGGTNCITSQRPILLVEAIKSDRGQISAWLEARGYQVIETGLNILAVHKADKGLGEIRISKAA
jgi:FkbM family methyltransferase